MAKKVLIIEDSVDIGDSLKLLIELEGYEAIVARRGFEGFDLALSEVPDLILMDVDLPDVNGIDLTRNLRAERLTADVPILCVSSYTFAMEDEVLRAGCNEVFTKSSFITSFGPTLKKYLEN